MFILMDIIWTPWSSFWWIQISIEQGKDTAVKRKTEIRTSFETRSSINEERSLIIKRSRFFVQ